MCLLKESMKETTQEKKVQKNNFITSTYSRRCCAHSGGLCFRAELFCSLGELRNINGIRNNHRKNTETGLNEEGGKKKEEHDICVVLHFPNLLS